MYKIGELFCGAGGMALGSEWAGCEHVWAVDNDRDSIATFRRNFPNCRAICDDVKDIHLSDLSAIDGLLGGFPCNDFSLLGNQKGLEGEYGPLYQYMVKVLHSHQPKFFIGENVGNVTARGALDVIESDFKNAGYEIYRRKYNFADYGVPQNRIRIIVVGFRKDLKVDYRYPEPTHIDNPITTSQAIDNIDPNLPNSEITKHPPEMVARISHIQPGDNIWIAHAKGDLPDHLMIKWGIKNKNSKVYRRQPPDRPSYTITAVGGGGNEDYHHREPRALTNRERARLQSFPDTFVFEGSKGSVRRQIGMAVSPLFSKVIVESVMEALARPKRRTGNAFVGGI